MLTPIKDTEILRRYSQPPGEYPQKARKEQTGSITSFPNTSLDLPAETFKNAINRREQNRKELLQWIRHNLKDGIHFSRIHLDERCRYAQTGSPNLCRDISHYSRPILLKSGAESIIGVLGLTATFPNLKQYEMACVHRQEIQTVVLKCELKTSNGTVVAEGAGARHIRQDNWNLNTCIKMAVKSALVDAVVRICGLSEVLIKTNQHTLTTLGARHKQGVPGMSDCDQNSLSGRSVCNKRFPGKSGCNSHREKPITMKQKHLIQTLSGLKGLTIEGLGKQVHSLFNKDLDDLNRVEASKLIQHLNG